MHGRGVWVCARVGELLAEACPWQLTWTNATAILLQAAEVEHDIGGMSAFRRRCGAAGVTSVAGLVHGKGDVQLEHMLATPKALLRGGRQIEKKREVSFAREGDQLVQAWAGQ